MTSALWYSDPSDRDTAQEHFVRKQLPPEKRLLFAVLEDAVDTIRSRPRNNPQRLLALNWVYSPDRSHIFTFEMICELLELNADYLRSGILRLASKPTAVNA
jgi:hypothetical protein